MSQQNNSGWASFKAAGAIPAHARVTISAAGVVDVAGLTDTGIGTAEHPAIAAGADVRVKLWSAPGTHKVIASEAFAVAAPLYTESDGEVQDTAQATSFPIGIAVEAAGADQDVVEMVPITSGAVAS